MGRVSGVVDGIAVKDTEIGIVFTPPGSSWALGVAADGVRNEVRTYLTPKASKPRPAWKPLVIGGAITQRPDLFGAALIRVGVSNALRFENTESVLNTPEFGSVETEDGFKGLVAMDAYGHVKDGTPYPAILLTTGATDPRVAPWQPAKMAARLQAATSSGKPVLLRVDYDAGHGLGSTAAQRDPELADEEAFLLSQLH